MWNTWSQYLSVTPFSVSSQNLNGTNLWDVDDNNQDWCTNFGLNLELTVKCDLTSVICNQATIFAEAYQKHVSLKLIERMAYTTRNNYIAAKNEEAIQTVKLDSHFAIQNKDNNTDGLALEVKKLIKGIDIDLSNLNTVCMPCRQSKGIKKSTA